MSGHVADTTGTPLDTVRTWWQALQDHDTPALAATLDEQYINVGGPGGRTIGKSAALTEAQDFLTTATIDTWSLTDPVERVDGPVAVCSYTWAETGRHDGSDFHLAGVATDVLVRRDHRWVITVHHTSITIPSGELP